jgi:AcrR family transcriptional regulator
MPAMAPRKYDQKVRAQAAARTRAQILQAVAQRLAEAPAEPVSLDQVAHLAGVARSTIYVVFGSRAGLFDAFTADLWERTGLAGLSTAVASPDARAHLRGGLIAACRMYAADLHSYRVLFAMNRLDPDSVGGAVAGKERNRWGGMSHLARRLADDRLLREGLTAEHAAELLWVLCSFEAFDLLHTDRGLTVDQAAEVLADAAERALCR